MFEINKMPASIDIGIVGETNFRTIQIDMSAWMEDMPAGVPSIIHMRPAEREEDAYIAATTFDSETNVLSWTITAGDLGIIDGEGIARIWLEELDSNDEVAKRGKSLKIKTIVHGDEALDPTDEPPAAQAAWLEQMTELKDATVEAAEDAEDAKDDAEAAEAAAEGSAEDAEAYAVGKRNGTDVDSDDPAYHNNAKYYSEEAASTLANKADKVTGGTADNFAALDAGGNLIDSGKKGDDFATKADTVFTNTISKGRKSGSQVGVGSIAFGNEVEATNAGSTALGAGTKSSNRYSVATGYYTVASGKYSHAEGNNTVAQGESSHAEGEETEAHAMAHAEGSGTTASGKYSHSEGRKTTANHKSQHVFGEWNADDNSSAATSERGNFVEIVGNGTASNAKSNARTLDWNGNERLKGSLYVEANANGTGGKKVAKEEDIPDVTGKADKSDTVLETTLSRGRKANTTVGTGSIAFGLNVEASGDYSSAFGLHAEAKGKYSNAFGSYAKAIGIESHAEGHQTEASDYAHSEGYATTASGNASHAEGAGTIANHNAQHVSGTYNVPDDSVEESYFKGNFVEIIGNGTATNARSNARTLDWSGNERLKGDLYVGANADGTGGKKVAKEEDIPDVTGKADKVTSPTAGNFAALDSNGNLTDSGHNAGEYGKSTAFLLANDFDASENSKVNLIAAPYSMNQFLQGKLIYANGTINDSSNSCTSPLIPISAGTYGLKTAHNSSGLGQIKNGNSYKNGYGFFAADGTTVVERPTTLLHNISGDIFVFDVPSDAKYVRFSFAANSQPYYEIACGFFNSWILLPNANDQITDTFFDLGIKKGNGTTDKIKRTDGSYLEVRDNRFGIRTRMQYGAHNGAEYYAPECTVPAYRIAGQQRWEYAWMSSIHFSSEGSMYVIHDDTVDRTTDGTGYINQMTDAQIDALHIDQTGEGYDLSDFDVSELKIPTFEQALQQCVRYGMKMVIGLHQFPTEYTSAGAIEKWDAFVNLLKAYNVPTGDVSCYVGTAATAAICRNLLGNDVEIAVFLGQNYTAQDYVDWFTTNSITGNRAAIINVSQLDLTAVKLLHINGIRVYAYGSHAETDANNCASWGVDVYQNSKLHMLTE